MAGAGARVEDVPFLSLSSPPEAKAPAPTAPAPTVAAPALPPPLPFFSFSLFFD